MFLNLQDPDSIVAWWREYPERHWTYLDALAELSPQFRPAIAQARRRIESDPGCRELLARARRMVLAANWRAAAAEQAGVDVDQQDFAPRYGALH